jgi:hypothetical protein
MDSKNKHFSHEKPVPLNKSGRDFPHISKLLGVCTRTQTRWRQQLRLYIFFALSRDLTLTGSLARAVLFNNDEIIVQ